MSPQAFSHASGHKGICHGLPRQLSCWLKRGKWLVWAIALIPVVQALNINSDPVFSASRGPHCSLCVQLPVPQGWVTLAQNTCTLIHTHRALMSCNFMRLLAGCWCNKWAQQEDKEVRWIILNCWSSFLTEEMLLCLDLSIASCFTEKRNSRDDVSMPGILTEEKGWLAHFFTCQISSQVKCGRR